MQRNAALVHVPGDRAADLGLLGLLLVEGDDLQVNLPLGLVLRRPVLAVQRVRLGLRLEYSGRNAAKLGRNNAT